MSSRTPFETVLERIEAPVAEIYDVCARKYETMRIGQLVGIIDVLTHRPGDFGDKNGHSPRGTVIVNCEAVRLETHIPNELDPEETEEFYSLTCIPSHFVDPHLRGAVVKDMSQNDSCVSDFEADFASVIKGRELLSGFIKAAKIARRLSKK